MEKQVPRHFRFTKSLLAIVLILYVQPIYGQVAQSCTSSLISSFTPCFNYITGSTNGGGSPTTGCCQALAAVISTSTDCACLILTGNVPLGSSLPINRTLAISLPKACKSTNSSSVPLKCRGIFVCLFVLPINACKLGPLQRLTEKIYEEHTLN